MPKDTVRGTCLVLVRETRPRLRKSRRKGGPGRTMDYVSRTSYILNNLLILLVKHFTVGALKTDGWIGTRVNSLICFTIDNNECLLRRDGVSMLRKDSQSSS